MSRFLWICLGGAIGTGARYVLSTWVARHAGPSFPFGTLTVNVVGSFVLGALMPVGLTTDWMSPTLRLALTTGVLGGFTTYSSFNYEALQSFEEGAWLVGALYVGATLVGCLVAGVLGLATGR